MFFRLKERNSTSFNGDCLTKNRQNMAIIKKEENLTFCYKDFCISANGQAIKMLASVALTIVVIAGVITLIEKR